MFLFFGVLNPRQHRALADLRAGLGVKFHDDAGERRGQPMLHLHRFEGEEALAFADGVARCDFHAGDPASQACTWEWLGGDCLSRSSFHPKKDGTGDPGYAGVMRKRLVEIGYTGS